MSTECGKGVTSSLRRDIEMLRALAVSMVVVYHGFPTLLPGGFIGVDVFFVISGFLITSTMARDFDAGRFSLSRFYAHRARRLLPALAVMLVIVAITGLLIFSPAELKSLGGEIASSALYGSNVWFWRHSGYFAPNAVEIPLLHTWSLGVEEQFYLLWPPAFLALWRWRRWRSSVVLLAMTASFALALLAIAYRPNGAFYLLPSRAWELLAGAALALTAVPPLAAVPRAAVRVIGLLLIVASALLLDRMTPMPGMAVVPAIAGAVLLIAAGDHGGAGLAQWLTRPFIALGGLSYALYLWHWPVLVLVPFWVGHLLPDMQRLGLIALSLGLAAMSTHWIERRWRREVRIAVIARMALMVTLGLAALGGLFMQSNGLPQRFPDSVASVDDGALYAGIPMLDHCAGDSAPTLARCDVSPSSASSGTILLWGDSHAGHFAPAVMASAQARGWSLALRSGKACFPAIGPPDSLTAYRTRACIAANRRVLGEIDTLIARGELRLVALAARWSSYLPESAHVSARDRLAGWVIGFDPAADDLTRRLEAVVRHLRSRGIAVLIIDQAPQFGLSPRICAVRARLFARAPSICAAPEALPPGRRERLSEILTGLARRQGAAVLHPTRQMCGPNGFCRTMRNDGGLLFADSNHLSFDGVNMLAGGIDRAIGLAIDMDLVDPPRLSP